MPRIVDHKERRREIAAAVLRVVARDGLKGVTMRNVAAESGWSTGVLHHYFEGKRELLVAGLRQAAYEMGKHLEEAMQEKRGVDRLQALLEEGIPLDARRLALSRIFIFFWGEAIDDENLSTQQQKYYDTYRSLIRQTLEEGQREGWVRELDTQMLAEVLVALTDGLAVQSTFQAETITAERQQEHVAAWLRFLAPRNAAPDVTGAAGARQRS